MNGDMKRLYSGDQELSSAAQTVASINDLMLQILSRLRLKPLFRLKSVSKHWNSLISDLKLQPNTSPAVGLIIHPTNRDRSFACVAPFEKSVAPTYLPLHRENVEIKIMHGCNGLLVYSATENETFNRQYFVINPTTMQRTMLPEPMYPGRIIAMCLSFDPSKSPLYKVVCVSGWTFGSWCKYSGFQVYSSETGSWRYATKQCFKGFLDVENGVYWNGALHWIPVYSISNSVYFDPELLLIRVFPTPPTLDYYGYCSYFGESSGHLHFVKEGSNGLTVYEMKTDYSEWFVKYRSSIDWSQIHGPHYPYSICGLFRGEKDEDCFLVLRSTVGIIRLHIVSGALEILHDLPYYSHVSQYFPNIESICSV